ncbi:hypothetical protein BD410DRAFT_783821 [Rickenella mellea]|uniref:DNA polymerase delta subunit 4 n=1 Tax=Rickenella mellea TaxID=50990 RepID=A0A4Y7QHK9_9AGAM|nr:hypothetical protein BD410DRAFT_783821 [Rickenella mellea]
MAPSKSSAGQKTRKATSTLSQARLSFATSKRTASAAKGAKPAPRAASIKSDTSVVHEVPSSSSSSGSESEAAPVIAPKIRTRSSATAKVDKADNEERADVFDLEKSGKLRRHYGKVRERMGNLPPIHTEGQTMSHQILRVFDNSYEYGPCVGVTRLERWERAQLLGLNPPTEVRDILLTKQAQDDDSLKQTVFYDEV